jgi:hypothetical protein
MLSSVDETELPGVFQAISQRCRNGLQALPWTGFPHIMAALATQVRRLTLSLAFLAPEIVKAAIDGRLARGGGISRLSDLPVSWREQEFHPRRIDAYVGKSRNKITARGVQAYCERGHHLCRQQLTLNQRVQGSSPCAPTCAGDGSISKSGAA